MTTEHKIYNADSRNMRMLPKQSVDLIVTSPPYPMITMWDDLFREQNPTVNRYLEQEDGMHAFFAMHAELNRTWAECDRVLKDGGIICINIGDATRKMNGKFAIYPNHAEILGWFFKQGYSPLPDILWSKPSNSPSKFLGSGMYPVGAYVTYEHEYILTFRKGENRVFKTEEEKANRKESAFFFEERNKWFSDIWDIKGTKQSFSTSVNTRERNASYPLEIPYRLVNMYSVKGDTVLDPFAGLATTSLACMLSERNSIAIEKAIDICQAAGKRLETLDIEKANKFLKERINQHRILYKQVDSEQTKPLYSNKALNVKVKTKQEIELNIRYLTSVKTKGKCNRYIVTVQQ